MSDSNGQLRSTFLQPCINLTLAFENAIESNHRYRKYLNRLLQVCYVPATSAVLITFFSCFFAAAINSTNEANKAASMHH